MLLRNSILLRADHPGSGSGPLPCTALALSWKLLLVQATLTTTQVTCGTTGDITGGGADNSLVTGDM